MPSQLPHVNCRYGAPMGRWTSPDRKPAGRTVRLFRVILDAGGYDQGGAYWGTGGRLYCATDGRDYQDFTRANSRAAAAVALGVTDRLRRGTGGRGGALMTGYIYMTINGKEINSSAIKNGTITDCKRSARRMNKAAAPGIVWKVRRHAN